MPLPIPILVHRPQHCAPPAPARFGTMWMAVFADVGSCLLVVKNGLRLLNGK